MPSGYSARILDDQGEPVAGAAVRWVDTLTLENGSTMTDASGGFCLPPGGTSDRLLVIRVSGYATGAHTLSAKDSRLSDAYVIHREPAKEYGTGLADPRCGRQPGRGVGERPDPCVFG